MIVPGMFVCSSFLTVCEVVVVPYVVCAVVAVTVMHVLLFVLHVCVCCEGDGSAGVVAVSACMSGTRDSGVLSSTGDMLVRGVVPLYGHHKHQQPIDNTQHLHAGNSYTTHKRTSSTTNHR